MNRVVIPARQCRILEQSVRARNRVGIVLSYRPGRLAGGIDSLESIPRFLKTLKIPSLVYDHAERIKYLEAHRLLLGPTGDTELVKSIES
jgi:hypothetical protein